MKDYMVILLKELVILPGQEIKIELLTEVSKKIINKSSNELDSKILVVAPITQNETNPSVDDLPKIGVIATIKSKFVLPNGNLRVTLIGDIRIIIKNYFYNVIDKDILNADTLVLKLPKFNKTEESALKRKLKKSIKNYTSLNTNVSNSILNSLEKDKNLDELTDLIARFLPFDVHKKLEYMQMINPLSRAQNLILDIEEELEVIKLEYKIDERVKLKLNSQEKKFIIEEKIKVLKDEIGEISVKETEIESLKKKLKALKLDKSSNSKLLNEIEKYEKLTTDSPESGILYNYLDTVLNLPYNKKSIENLDKNNVNEILNSSHFGLNQIKDRIIDYVSIKKIAPLSSNPIICLVGAPGVGKTSIAKEISKCLNREFVKISVGGLSDSIELVGSRKTYLGASCGKIISGIKKAGVNNPLILIDEVDKMTKDYKGDPASTLLEILDPVQHNMFIDNYVEEPFDLSNVFFILTANNEDDIPYILKDRLEIIKIDNYSIEEKYLISSNHLIPKILKEYNDPLLNIKDDILYTIIKRYTKEAGVRDLDRMFHKYIRKIIVNRNLENEDIRNLLGPYIYDETDLFYTDSKTSGVINALATTKIGGTITQIEVIKTSGKGEVNVTGNVGKIMDESIKVALSYLKSNYKINFNKNELHMHFIEGAILKDGPSAGVAIATSLVSIYENIPVSNKIAFTGEISLNGHILKVGGIKDKIVAAINNGLETIYIPFGNKNDIINIDMEYLSKINIKCVKVYEEIYKDLFINN